MPSERCDLVSRLQGAHSGGVFNTAPLKHLVVACNLRIHLTVLRNGQLEVVEPLKVRVKASHGIDL